jgi:hypothetical protein
MTFLYKEKNSYAGKKVFWPSLQMFYGRAGGSKKEHSDATE